MKKQLFLLFLVCQCCWLTATTVEFDTIKTLSKQELEVAATVEQLRNGLIDLRLAERKKDTVSLLNANLKIGQLYGRQRYYSKAVAYYRQAADFAKKLGDESSLGLVQTLLGGALLDNKQGREAHDIYLRLLPKHEAAGRYEATLNTLQKLAEACLSEKLFPETSKYYGRIKELAQSKNDWAAVAMALNNLGFAAHRAGDHAGAVAYFTEAEVTAQQHQKTMPGYVFSNLGIAWHNLGEMDRSVDNLKKAEELGGAGLEKSYVEMLIASIYLKNEDVYNALRYNESAVNSARKAKNPAVLSDAYDMASQIYQQLFEYDKALDFHKKHLSLKDSLLRVQQLEQQELVNFHALLEQSENDFKQKLAQDEVNALTMAGLKAETERLELFSEKQRLESEAKSRELALLEQEQLVKDAQLRTATLEAEKTKQALALLTQENLNDRKNQKIAALNAQLRIDSLESVRLAAQKQREIEVLETQKIMNEMELAQQEEFRNNAYKLGALGGGILLVIFFSWLYARRLNKRLAAQNQKIEAQKEEIDAERNRAEELLLNILPGKVAQELKDNGSATPHHYESATVLFTDFQGFTKIASSMPPTEVVKELNECFLAFDGICDRHHLEKIKTIGDSFMCVGGLPVKNSTHPQDAVAAALEMLAFIENRNRILRENGLAEWPIRIGIHTGEVVAGVVGSRKFAYDVWGDTVNVASRMEGNCPAGQVNISAATFPLVSQSFMCEYRGEVEVKNKGGMGMYLVRKG